MTSYNKHQLISRRKRKQKQNRNDEMKLGKNKTSSFKQENILKRVKTIRKLITCLYKKMIAIRANQVSMLPRTKNSFVKIKFLIRELYFKIN